MKTAKKLVSLFACIAMLCTMAFSVFGVSAVAASSAPTMPEGAKNYADDITGAQRVGPYWDDSYYTLSTDPLSLELYVGTDALHLTGAQFPADYVIEADVTMPAGVVNKPDYRFTIGDASNYVRVMSYDAASHIYHESDADWIIGGADYKVPRAEGETLHYVFKKEGTKLSVWMGGNLVFDSVEVGNIGGGFGLHLCGSWVGGDDHTVGVKMENIKIYNAKEDTKKPVRIETNKNRAEEITGAQRVGPYWADDYYTLQTNPLSLELYVGTDALHLTGAAFPENYAIEADVTLDAAMVNKPDYRFTIGDSSAYVRVMTYDAASHIYGESDSEYFTGGVAHKVERPAGETLHYTFVKEGTKLTVWVNDALIFDKVEVGTIGGGFGLHLNGGWVGGSDHTIGVKVENVDIYNLDADPIPPSMPTRVEHNTNYAESINGIADLWGCAFDAHFAMNADGTITAKNGACPSVFTGYSLEADKAYVVSATLDMAAAGEIRFAIGGSQTHHTGLYTYANKINVYSNAWPSWDGYTGVDSTNFAMATGGQNFTFLFEKEDGQLYVTLWVDGEAIMWTNGSYKLAIADNGTGFGIQNNSGADLIIEALDVYYVEAEPVPECNHEYFNDCDPICMICGEETREASHNVIHVAAKDATCTENGNIEYWYCDACGAAWLDEACTLNTNLKAVLLGATCANTAEHVAAKAATCYEPGNTEYWYCANCDVYYADEACTIITNAKNVVIPVSHNVIHVEAAAPTCDAPGNIEYWYCDVCGQAWLDELCRMNTNLKAVVLPIAHNVIHVEAKEPTALENGNIEYWYCADCGAAWLDELCHMNTNLKAVVLPAIDGWFEANGKTFYAVNGEKLTGLQKIGDVYYFFSTGNGTLKKGGTIWVKADNAYGLEKGTYNIGENGVIEIPRAGFVTEGDKTYYIVNGEKLKGLQEIDGNYYYFATGTANMQTNKTIWVKANNAYGLAAGHYEIGADGVVIVG